VAQAKKKRGALSRKRVRHRAQPKNNDPELEALVREIIGRVADKWTMLVLEALTEHGRLRFTRLVTACDRSCSAGQAICQ
jgi:DNA-binding HxlR family transcriptional regulator